jgi:hypothetical protein
VRGFPFTLGGLLPASDPALVDLTGDGRPEIAMLTSQGAGGAWRLYAWDVAGSHRGAAIPGRDIVRMPVSP